MTRIFITSTIMARVRAGRKAFRPEHIIRPHPPTAIISLKPPVPVVTKLQLQPNLGISNPAHRPQGSPDNTSLARLPKDSQDNTNPNLGRQLPGNLGNTSLAPQLPGSLGLNERRRCLTEHRNSPVWPGELQHLT
ncbi:MAG: hypothetical protein ACYC6G_12800 [Desulfobaccales bacterium]